MEKFQLIDDGTMDTVIRCNHCNEEMRFNPEMPEMDDPFIEPTVEENENYRIDQAFEMAEQDHECAPFTYSIDLDERGSFCASVSDRDGKTVFSIKDGNELEEGETSIFEDGFMKNKNDLAGLRKHLIELGIMTEDDSLEVDK